MANSDVRAAALICIDGWGLREEEYGNAVWVRPEGTKVEAPRVETNERLTQEAAHSMQTRQ